MKKALWTAAIGALLVLSPSQAIVLQGPTSFPYATTGWNVSGLGIVANVNTKLSAFTFENGSNADTVVLTDHQGHVLHSLSTPAGTPGYQANVAWWLAGGQRYWLLQTTPDNGKYTPYPHVSVQDADINFVQTGTLGHSITDAVINAPAWYPNPFWSTFTDISTVAPTPEPATIALLGMGLLGALRLRRRQAG
jgi:hypothetical protein